ncbi:ribonuclease H-like domain-containing protein [Mycena alexandri]|uniref:Ribonuclease H-like domain-containing protein n=1 Tax=Mycena alexandri TaxID=1745969 RepID=A0AAD6RZ41_9AGAR|nr:ribonuclease H-like domain-containing protein [Mycena alexandri]
MNQEIKQTPASDSYRVDSSGTVEEADIDTQTWTTPNASTATPYRVDSSVEEASADAQTRTTTDASTHAPAKPMATDPTDSLPASPVIYRENPEEGEIDEEEEGPELTDADVDSLAMSMITMGHLNIATVTYITTESQANDELARIVDGVIGFDTEFVKRILYGDEAIIDSMPLMGSSAKKTARLAMQYLESRQPLFSVQWEKTGLCLVQLAQGEAVWVLNMNRIKGKLQCETLCASHTTYRPPAFPSELQRIIESPVIIKAGAGILSDGVVIWEDLRSNARNLVDVGLMARLWGVTNHQEEPFSNLALDAATIEVLGIAIDKTFQRSVNWKMEPNRAHIIYAAIDAAAALRLHEALAPDMAAEDADPETTFSADWYTFNSTFGEATRTKRSIRGAEIPWSMKDCSWYSNNRFQGKYY